MAFNNRGKRCDEQMALLKQLWTQTEVDFEGKFETIKSAGLNPLPVQQPIPMWIGARPNPSRPVIRRIGRQSDGWFVLASPEEFPEIRDAVFAEAESAGRSSTELGQEAGVAVVGPREAEWQDRVIGWKKMGLTHLCLRTLGGGLSAREHLDKLKEAAGEIPDEVR